MKWNSTADEGDRRRVEAVVETLASVRNPGESVAELAHDARNMVTALALYCDLLEEPGVLNASFLHYGSELRLVATASRRLVEKLVLLGSRDSNVDCTFQAERPTRRQLPTAGPLLSGAAASRPSDRLPGDSIPDLNQELLANRTLLAAMAGPSIALDVKTSGGARPVRLSGEDLTRVLVNLVKNAAEAMRRGGHIQIELSESTSTDGNSKLLLTLEDDGLGIPAERLETVFEPGFTTHSSEGEASRVEQGGWPAIHRGLGLSITRSIIEAAGGRILASNATPKGARFAIELPVLTR
jgi:signal transduction histidine kinase